MATVPDVNVLQSQREYLEAITDPELLQMQVDAETIYGPEFDTISLARTQTLLEGIKDPKTKQSYKAAQAQLKGLEARKKSLQSGKPTLSQKDIDELAKIQLRGIYERKYWSGNFGRNRKDERIQYPPPTHIYTGGWSKNSSPKKIVNPDYAKWVKDKEIVERSVTKANTLDLSNIDGEIAQVKSTIENIESQPGQKGLVQMADEAAMAAAETQNKVNRALREGDLQTLEDLGEQATAALRDADPQTKAIVEATTKLAERAAEAAELGVQADQERNNLQAIANRQQARIAQIEALEPTNLTDELKTELESLKSAQDDLAARASDLQALSTKTRTQVPGVDALNDLKTARKDIAAGRETAATNRLKETVGGTGSDIAALEAQLGAQQTRQAALETAAGANLLEQNTEFDIARDRARDAGTASARLAAEARAMGGLASDREAYAKYLTPEQQALTQLAEEAGGRDASAMNKLRDLAGTADLETQAAAMGTAGATEGQAGVSESLAALAASGAGLADRGDMTVGQKDVKTRFGMNQNQAALIGGIGSESAAQKAQAERLAALSTSAANLAGTGAVTEGQRAAASAFTKLADDAAAFGAQAAPEAQQALRGQLDAADTRAVNISGLGATTDAQQAQLDRLIADQGISRSTPGGDASKARLDALATIQGRGSELYGTDTSAALAALRGETDLARTYAETQMGRGDTLFEQASKTGFDPTGNIFRYRSAADRISEQANQLARDAMGPLSAQRRRLAEQAARQQAARTGRLGDTSTLAAELLNREESRAALRAEAREAARLSTELQGTYSDRALRAQEQARADALAFGEAGLAAQQQAFAQQAGLEQTILGEDRARRAEATQMEMDALAAQSDEAQARETQMLQRQVASAEERAQRESQIQSLTSQLVQQGLDAATASAQAEATVNQQKIALESDIAQQGITRGQTALDSRLAAQRERAALENQFVQQGMTAAQAAQAAQAQVAQQQGDLANQLVEQKLTAESAEMDALNKIAQQRSEFEAGLVAQGLTAAEAAQQAQQAALDSQARLETDIGQQNIISQQNALEAQLAARQLGFQQAQSAEQTIADEARALRGEEVGLIRDNLARIDDIRKSAVDASVASSAQQANIAQMEFDEAARRRAEATQAADTAFSQQQAIAAQRQAEEARRFEEASQLRAEGLAEAQLATGQQQSIIDAQMQARQLDDAKQASLRSDELAARQLGADLISTQAGLTAAGVQQEQDEARRLRDELAATEQTAFNTQAALANMDAAEESNLFNQAVTGQQLAFGQSQSTGGDPAALLLGRSSGAGGAGAGMALGAGAAGQAFAPLFDASAGTNLALAQATNQANLDMAQMQADASATPTSSGGSNNLSKFATAVKILSLCWVAREVYGEANPKWVRFREWMLTKGPRWFLNLYIKYGERFAKFISNKPMLKSIIRKWMDTKI